MKKALFFVIIFCLLTCAGCAKNAAVTATATVLPEKPTITLAATASTALTAAPDIPTATPEPSPTPAPEDFGAKVNIGELALHYRCAGEGSPTILLETGMNEPIAIWEMIFAELAAETRVCAYDRAFLGYSDPSPNSKRTSQDVVDELALLLEKAEIAPPYILVGHSIAAFHIRVFTDRYPDQVLGVVLLDGAHPDLSERLRAELPEKDAEEHLAITSFRDTWTKHTISTRTNRESFHMGKSADEVHACKDYGDLPLLVFSAQEGHSLSRFGPLPADTALKVEAAWQEMQKELAALSSQGEYIPVSGNHAIFFNHPDLLVERILGLLADIRGEA